MWLARLSWPRYALVMLVVAGAIGLVGGILWGAWAFGVAIAVVIFLGMLYARAEVRVAFGVDPPSRPKA
jgi:hypothetical protein